VNWNAGGNNSISGLIKGQFIRTYTKENIHWKNELIMRYGINKQESQEVRKTDDQFAFNSTFGYKRDTISNWYYAGKFNFNTQFANGYAYPNVDLAISRPFAPAYAFLGIGAEYSRKDLNLNFYLSPLTQKTTMVFDQRLANQGAFGVEKAVYDEFGTLIREGKNIRNETGILVTNQWKREIFENINFENRIALYTDYINNFGNIDIDWQIQLDLTVNQYVKANIGTHLVYDDDIKSKQEEGGVQVVKGPKIQLKQLLGLGVVYQF
jgi:outer membrane protease